jgi:type II secretion system protein C
MNRLFNDKVLSIIFRVLVLAAIAKSIALAAFVFLPKNGLESVQEDRNLVNFNAYGPTSPFAVSESGNAARTATVDSFKLLAVYKEADSKDGFAIISDGGSPQVVKSGESYKQYKLGEIKQDGVYLIEGGSSVWVGFAKSTLAVLSPQQPSVLIPQRGRIGDEKMLMRNAFAEQDNETYTNMIQRSEIQELMSNPDNVFKNIGFKEVMKDGKIDGFRVLSINRNSPLAKLGLRAGDIVQSFNGVRLDNYSSVLEIYNNADTISRVKLEVMRNNEKKEFEYEIY